jgi:hypothetical protein
LQLQEGLAAPQREEAQTAERSRATNLQAALQVLGLSQQAQQAQQQQALGERTLGVTEAGNRAQAEAARQRGLVDAAQIASQPGVPGGVSKALALAFPQLAQGMEQQHTADVTKAAGTMTPQVEAIYRSGTAPGKMAPMLTALKGSNPEAFNQLDWPTLNAILSGGGAEGPGFMASREGGVLTPILPKTEEELQKNRAANLGMQLGLQPGEEGTSLLDVLFGKKKKKTQPK